MIVVAIANQKGGVGKTISAVTLAHGAAQAGKRVLVVDLDPQGNVADSVGIEAQPALYHWLGDGRALLDVVVPARPNLWIVPGDKQTAVLKTSLAARGWSEYALGDRLPEATMFDLVILDCAPSLDVLHTSAIMAADYLVIPAKLDSFAVKGVGEIITTLATARRHNAHCELVGVLPTFYDRVSKETQVQLTALAQAFAGLIWPPIPTDTQVREANRGGKTLYDLQPAPRALRDGYAPALERLMEYVR